MKKNIGLNLKEKIDNIKDKRKINKLNKKKKHLEQEFDKKQAREAELLKEIQLIEEEKARLLKLDEKELQIELIFAVRGFYSRLETLENEVKLVGERIDAIESDISDLYVELQSLKEVNRDDD